MTPAPLPFFARLACHALAWGGAQVLTGLEAGVLAAALAMVGGMPLPQAVGVAVVLSFPLLLLQAWAFTRLLRPRPVTLPAPLPVRRVRRRLPEPLIGLGTLLGLTVTAPLAILAAAVVGAVFLVGAVPAPGEPVAGRVLGAMSIALFGALTIVALGWQRLAARLRGGSPISQDLPLHLPVRPLVLLGLIGGLAVGWFPSLVAEWLASSTSWAALTGSAGGASLAWLDGALTAGSGVDRLAMALAVALVAPVAEELIFRGVAWDALRRWVPGPGVLVITSVLFALAHADPVHTPAVLLIGLFLGWLRLASGSVLPGIIAHVLNNTLGVSVAHRSVAGVEVMPDLVAVQLGLLVLLATALAARALPTVRDDADAPSVQVR